MIIMVVLFILYLCVMAFGYWLRSINLRHLRIHGAEVPYGFGEAIDADILAKTTAYTLEQGRVGILESVVDDILLLVFLFGGLLGLYDHRISSLSCSFVTGGLPGLFGLAHSSFPAQLVILLFLGSLIAFPFTPLMSWLSRRQEQEADQFACELSGAPDALAPLWSNSPGKTLRTFTPIPSMQRSITRTRRLWKGCNVCWKRPKGSGRYRMINSKDREKIPLMSRPHSALQDSFLRLNHATRI